MKFEKTGNLGKVDLLDRLIAQKYFSENYSFTEEELAEVSRQLQKFNNLLANLNLYRNSLEDNGFKALVSLIDELDPIYRNYDPSKDFDTVNVF